MKDLVNALKNQGAYAILNDITAQGYCRRAKDNERATQENYNARKNIAEKLLKVVGMELSEFAECEED